MPSLPGTTNYPAGLDDVTSLGEVKNNASSTITGALTTTTLLIPVADPSEFPSSGFATLVDDLTTPTKIEIFIYTSKSGSNLVVPSTSERGALGTTAQTWSSGNFVEQRPVSGYHEGLRGGLIAAQTKLGSGSDTAAANEVLRGTGSGTSDWGAITNAYVSASAAIAYSKLNLTGAILNADLAGSIAISKLSITGTPDGTKFLRDDGSWQSVGGGAGDALTSNPLSQFAATTSAQLAGVISDETGSGALVFANTPTLVTPVLGVATVTSINKVAITAPASSATLTIADGKTLTANATLTLAGTDSTTITFQGTDTYVGRTTTDTLTNKTLTTPTIASFTNATHDHSNAAGGGTLNASVIAAGTLDDARLSANVVTLTGSQTLTNKVLTAPDINAGTADSLTSLSVRSTGAAFDLTIASSEVLTAGRTLSIVLGDAARTLTIGASASVSGANTGDQTNVTGNAGTATALQTARTINGTSFDGTANITVTAAAGTLTGSTLASGVTASSLTSFGSTPTIVTPSITTGFTIGGVAATGTIPRGNGTNFVASAFTMAAPGTSGNVLTSDGTNWLSSAPAGGGTTINSTDGVIPYRSNSTTFADSPLSVSTGRLTNTPTLQSSGAASYFRLITPVDTGQTASTEVIGAQFGGNTSAATVTRQWATGALTTQRENVFVAPTYAFVGASTLTTAATVAITGAPVAGTNATITNPYALFVQGGLSRFDGAIYITPTTVTDKIFLYSSGATIAKIGMSGNGPYLASFSGGDVYLQDASSTILTANKAGSTFIATDTSSTSVLRVLSLYHASSVFGANGVGAELGFKPNTTTTTQVDATAISGIWADATHATRSGAGIISVVDNAGSLTERWRIAGNGLGTGVRETVTGVNGSADVRGQITESLTLSTSGTTTDTAMDLPANSIILSVTARITTTITTATDWKLGDATIADRFSDANATMTANTTTVGINQWKADRTTAGQGAFQQSTAKVRVTTTGTPGAGVIRITIHYITLTAPTS